MYLTYRQENRTLADIGLWQESSVTLTDGDGAERMRALRVTDGTLQALGVQPMRGRWFTPAEHEPSRARRGRSFFRMRSGSGDSAATKRRSGGSSRSSCRGGNGTLRSTGPSQVVGILPPDFRFLDMTPQPDVIVAVRLDPDRQAHGIYSWQMLARLKPGVTLTQAQADLDRMRPIWLDAWPPFPGPRKRSL